MPVLYFDKQSLPQGVFWLSFSWGGRGGGGSFKLSKQEFRCVEESTAVSDLVVLLVHVFFVDFFSFLKGTQLYSF